MPVLIVVIVLAVVGVGAAVYFARQGTENGTDSENDTAMTEEGENMTASSEKQSASFTGTITDLLQRGEDLTCTFTRTDESGNAIAGTVYVASQGKQLRGDFALSQTDGTTMNGHVVRDGEANYFWSDQIAQGTKMTISEEVAVTPSPNSQQAMLDESIEYNCQPWAVDADMFTLPPDKEFVDISQQVQQINAATQGAGQAQCAACDQLQGTAQDQCRQALGC